MNQTKEIVESILKQNTGRHFLDSGDAYGRNWERNINREFEKEPATTISFKYGIDVTHNIYHWLNEKLTYDKEMDDLFHGKFREEVDADDSKNWLQLMEEFPEWLGKQQNDCETCEGTGKIPDDDSDGEVECDECVGTGKSGSKYGEVAGIYGEGEPLTDNSYNHECLLSQTIQYTYFEVGGEGYVALQVHGGADVRGGYATPKIFTTNDELGIMDYARGSIFCTGKDHHPTALALKEVQEHQAELPGIATYLDPIDFEGYQEHNFSTDDGVHWYPNGACGAGYKQLEKYEHKELTEEDNTWEPGTLCVDKENDIAYCPFCGAKLAAGF